MDNPSSNNYVPSEHDTPKIFEELEVYPWSDDQEFQSGLDAILGPPDSRKNASRLEDLTLRARCFYYARKYNIRLDFDAYRAWRASQPHSALSSLMAAPASPVFDPSKVKTIPVYARQNEVKSLYNNTSVESSHRTDSSSEQAPIAAQFDSPSLTGHSPSFAEIMELIKSGQPVPGVKDIPDIVLIGRGTESTQSRRQKPWELAKERRESETPDLFSSP